MSFFSRLKDIFRPSGKSEYEAPKGFWERRKERRQERKQEREYVRSQRRQEKMDRERREREEKERRKREEEQQKKEAEEKARQRDQKARETFKDRWGFNDQEYADFIKFIASIPDDLKEAFGSETLVEAFRTANEYGISGQELNYILQQTYAMSDGGTQEDIVNDLFINIQGYAQNMESGAFI